VLFRSIESNGTDEVLNPSGVGENWGSSEEAFAAGRTAVFDVMARNLRESSKAFISVPELKKVAAKLRTTVDQLVEDCFLHIPEGQRFFVSKD
jgi:hypothetical protein